MVVQRGAPLRLAGNGTPGADVTVSINGIEKSAKVSNNASWSVEFPAMKAGGPHVVKAVEGGTSVTLDDVLCGDVWLCSGQSNMQMGIREVVGGKLALAAAAAHTEIRILTVPRGGADAPKKGFNANWQRRSAEGGGDFSAVAWLFANHLKDDPSLEKVPLGIINSSFGGTAIEAWTPAGTLPEIPENQLSGSMFGIPPAALFNGMIHPLTGLRIKGVLWYQGEANAGQPTVYQKLLENLMTQWRAAWKQPELPFLIVQLPAFDGSMGDQDFSWLREAQAKACAETTNAWLAVTHDTTDGRDRPKLGSPSAPS
jgi:sialate O-acetylesterase